MVNTYEVNKLITDINGNILDKVRENEKLIIKTPSREKTEEYLKHQQMIKDRTELSEIIAAECGSFYFNFFNGGLRGMDIKESIKLRFLYLCTYTNYAEKGMYIVYDNGKKMDRGGIDDILGLSESEFKKTMTTLLKIGLLIKDGVNFMVNKDIVHRGKMSNSHTEHTRIFDTGLRELYKNCQPLQHKQLYYVFKLLPYVNLKFNVVCANPTEQVIDDVVPLKLNQICEIVGYNTTKSTRFKSEMLKLQLFGEYAILGIINGRGTWYKINPRVSYAGTSSQLEEFKKLLSTDFRVK